MIVHIPIYANIRSLRNDGRSVIVLGPILEHDGISAGFVSHVGVHDGISAMLLMSFDEMSNVYTANWEALV